MRLRKRVWVKEEIINNMDYSVNNPEKIKGKWEKLFGNHNPIYIELGTGRGRFLITHAQKNPGINYIAIEQKQEVLVQAIRKATRLGLTNIKFILGNVNQLLDFFADHEVARIYLNFVDPWPKKRHAKRRLTHNRFLDMYKNILENGGKIFLKTDNEGLFEFSLNELIRYNFRLKEINLNLYRNNDNFTEHIQTEYEEKFIKLGKPIYMLEAEHLN